MRLKNEALHNKAIFNRNFPENEAKKALKHSLSIHKSKNEQK